MYALQRDSWLKLYAIYTSNDKNLLIRESWPDDKRQKRV